MHLQVDTQTDDSGALMPRGFHLRARYVAVVETVDQWFGPDYRYVKVRGDDGGCYILRVHDAHGCWQLTMFQSAKAQTLSPVRRWARRSEERGIPRTPKAA